MAGEKSFTPRLDPVCPTRIVAKVGVEGSNPFARSRKTQEIQGFKSGASAQSRNMPRSWVPDWVPLRSGCRPGSRCPTGGRHTDWPLCGDAHRRSLDQPGQHGRHFRNEESLGQAATTRTTRTKAPSQQRVVIGADRALLTASDLAAITAHFQLPPPANAHPDPHYRRTHRPGSRPPGPALTADDRGPGWPGAHPSDMRPGVSSPPAACR